MKNCNECKYCILQDYGYSNYTVEVTTAGDLAGAEAQLTKALETKK